jgi:hypothetical protein
VRRRGDRLRSQRLPLLSVPEQVVDLRTSGGRIEPATRRNGFSEKYFSSYTPEWIQVLFSGPPLDRF